MIEGELNAYIKAHPALFDGSLSAKVMAVDISPDDDVTEDDYDDIERGEIENAEEVGNAQVLGRNAMRYFLKDDDTTIAKTGGLACNGPERSGKTPCPYEHTISVRTACFYLQGPSFYLNSRCMKCYASLSRRKVAKALDRPPESDETQLCRRRLTCMNVNSSIRIGCEPCIKLDTKKKLLWERQGSCKTNTHVGRGGDITNPVDMIEYLSKTDFPMPRYFDELRAMLKPDKTPSCESVNPAGSRGKSFALDTEWLQFGQHGTFLLSICVMTLPERRIVVNHRVELPIPQQDFKELCRTFPSRLDLMKHYNKHYHKQGSCSHLPVVDGNGLHQLLAAAGFGPDSRMIEWSNAWCDWRMLYCYLETYNKQDIMPAKSNSLRVIFTWMDLLPGFATHKLDVLAPCVLGDEYDDNAHSADSDTINLIAMAEKAVSLRIG
ncbi:hypothetical protein EDD37DRAFT_237176 [Exophiala viscosa]|uniref:uncharacterized protein n=1 Tax=Exophiala viscosa TaxID=2486360 RepID=UPI002197BFCD|nr:hypothetical protein EDD37DRAFT_237176 [Exophiala viscosa]